MAHLVEHLVFRSVRRGPSGAFGTVEFLKSQGIGFGACVNAATRFEETVYSLMVPTDTPGLVSQW